MSDICEDVCDHCRPEDFHRCARPAGHRGYCSCVPDYMQDWYPELEGEEDDDYDMDEYPHA